MSEHENVQTDTDGKSSIDLADDILEDYVEFDDDDWRWFDRVIGRSGRGHSFSAFIVKIQNYLSSMARERSAAAARMDDPPDARIPGETLRAHLIGLVRLLHVDEIGRLDLKLDDVTIGGENTGSWELTLRKIENAAPLADCVLDTLATLSAAAPFPIKLNGSSVEIEIGPNHAASGYLGAPMAAFVYALVNAYRSGALSPIATPPAGAEARREDIARIIDPVSWWNWDAVRQPHYSSYGLNGEPAGRLEDSNCARWRHVATGQIVKSIQKADAILALASAPAVPERGWRPTPERVRHVKQGTEYEVLGEAEIQIFKPTLGDTGRVAVQGRHLVLYRDVFKGTLLCGFPDEFRDGRFETIDTRAAGPAQSTEERP